MLQELKRAARGSVLETHPHYRTAIGALGVALPILLVLSSLAAGDEIRRSISAYYHGSARDWFVGTLWVLGVFLFFYRYTPLEESPPPRSQRESIRTGAFDAVLGKAAGLAAVAVALLPTEDEGTAVSPEIGMAHGIAAAILFLCLSLFPLLLFSQSRKRGHIYRAIGWTMIGLLLITAAYQFGPDGIKTALAPWKPLLILETLLVWSFGISWFEKGRELAAEEKVRPVRAGQRRVA